jgi:hypothetical protein
MVFVLAACNASSDTPIVEELPATATLQPIPSLTSRVTATIAPSNTPLPTFTFTPTLTEIPPTPSNTPVPTLTPTVSGIISAVQPINVREGPDTSFNIITALNAGEGVILIGQNNDGSWYNIRMSNGREGWVAEQFVRVEPSSTPFPTFTPSPDLTSLAQGTPQAPTQLVSGQATATPPPQAQTGIPVSQGSNTPVPTLGALVGIPTIDNSSIFLTATALADRGRDTTVNPTEDRVITVAPDNSTPLPESSESAQATPPPPPADTPTLSTGRRVRIFAFCDDPSYGTDLATIPAIRPGDSIVMWWGWIASTETQVLDHIEASNLELAVNGQQIADANSFVGDIQPFGAEFIAYWEVPFGPLAPGQYIITYQVTWDRAIYDGSAFYGPDTSKPFEQETCSFTVR